MQITPSQFLDKPRDASVIANLQLGNAICQKTV